MTDADLILGGAAADEIEPSTPPEPEKPKLVVTIFQPMSQPTTRVAEFDVGTDLDAVRNDILEALSTRQVMILPGPDEDGDLYVVPCEGMRVMIMTWQQAQERQKAFEEAEENQQAVQNLVLPGREAPQRPPRRGR